MPLASGCKLMARSSGCKFMIVQVAGRLAGWLAGQWLSHCELAAGLRCAASSPLTLMALLDIESKLSPGAAMVEEGKRVSDECVVRVCVATAGHTNRIAAQHSAGTRPLAPADVSPVSRRNGQTTA